MRYGSDGDRPYGGILEEELSARPVSGPGTTLNSSRGCLKILDTFGTVSLEQGSCLGMSVSDHT